MMHQLFAQDQLYFYYPILFVLLANKFINSSKIICTANSFLRQSINYIYCTQISLIHTYHILYLIYKNVSENKTFNLLSLSGSYFTFGTNIILMVFFFNTLIITITVGISVPVSIVVCALWMVYLCRQRKSNQADINLSKR